MPVPLSVTNPKAVGLVAAQAAELPTQGPFARMAQQPADQGSTKQAAAAAADPVPAATANGSNDWAVETCSLSFSYPDLGDPGSSGL